MRFWLAGLSTLSVPTSCLELKNKKNSQLTINDNLSKHNGVTMKVTVMLIIVSVLRIASKGLEKNRTDQRKHWDHPEHSILKINKA